MNVETGKMQEYASFMEETSKRIIFLCDKIEGNLQIASQCLDQESGKGAAARLRKSIDTIKANALISEDVSKRLVLSLKYVKDAGSVFRR